MTRRRIVVEEENPPSPFGKWIERNRKKQKLSVADLSDISGVSKPQLYNIIRGITQNPTEETRTKLESALKIVTPKTIIEEEQKSTSVGKLGSLEDFDPHDLESIPNESGVYVFYDISERPIYVGRSANIRRRIKQHQDRFWFKQPIVQKGSLIRIPDQELRKQIEIILIRFLKSNAVLNQLLVDRDLSDNE
ncbi:helix-turn-helix domain-containing protein [Bosea sp. TND4EK4]|uniref:helix-turn-helix domain-containing protein n=1 Tax=Bosea sp. TND4EK4 TaxID=1907408 RepID=UPI000970F613|nr:helix-turn-helix domain-containing protein [Bosea sp. TND4EK4]